MYHATVLSDAMVPKNLDFQNNQIAGKTLTLYTYSILMSPDDLYSFYYHAADSLQYFAKYPLVLLVLRNPHCVGVRTAYFQSYSAHALLSIRKYMNTHALMLKL